MSDDTAENGMNPLSRPQHFKLYPRGFFGAVPQARIEKAPKGVQIQLQQVRNTFQLSSPATGGALVPNEDVEALYAQNIKGNSDVMGFDFQERMLSVALSAFGTSLFDFWFMKQSESPAFGDSHMYFLDDCIRFLDTGKRNMDINVWNTILVHSDTGELHNSVSEYARDFFARRAKDRQGNEVRHILQTWLSHKGGQGDLLCTLHVLFGSAA